MAAKRISIVGAAVAAACTAMAVTAPAWADQIYISNISQSSGEAYVVLNDVNNATGQGAGSLQPEQVGEFTMTAYNGSGPSGSPFTLQGWCVDVNDGVNIGNFGASNPDNVTYNASAGVSLASSIAGAQGNVGLTGSQLNLSPAAVQEISYLSLYGIHNLTTSVPTDSTSGGYLPTSGSVSAANPQAQAIALSTAIQVLIWQVEYGMTFVGVANVDTAGNPQNDPGTAAGTQYANATGVYSVTAGLTSSNGSTWASGADYSFAQAQWLSGAVETDISTLQSDYDLYGSSTPEQVTGLVDPSGSQALFSFVPEPASLALLAGGLVGFGTLRRRRRRAG